jgi:glycosyltransferase involved in cell wall biosynthesis
VSRPSGSEPTRVLVNLTWLVPGVVGGSEESLTDTLRAVAATEQADLQLRLAVLAPFVDAHRDLAGTFDCSVLRMDGRNKALRVLAEQTWLALEARRCAARVVHHAGGVVPLVHPGSAVLTIQDLQPLDLPENFSAAKRAYIHAMAGRSARGAAVVQVPSGFSRDRVVELLGVDPARVAVVPWFPRPVGGDGAPCDPAEPEVEGSFLLYPAITYPHKNHRVLLDAFAIVAARSPGVRLVLTGGEGAAEAEVRRRIDEPDLRGRVVRTGRIPRARLEALYRSAAAVVVPSRYEGFGLPVLEAMARGCPVIVAAAGSLPEVSRSEDLVDPDDVEAWSAAMERVLTESEAQRAARVTAGRRLAAGFTPAATAAGLIDAYRRAALGTDSP